MHLTSSTPHGETGHPELDAVKRRAVLSLPLVAAAATVAAAVSPGVPAHSAPAVDCVADLLGRP